MQGFLYALDFGNAPILRTLPGGKRIIVIGQKSGNVWGLDPDNEGKVLWSFPSGNTDPRP